MLTFREFLSNLAGELAGLACQQRLAFGASCCERAAPNYERVVKSGEEANVLREALDLVWSGISSGRFHEAAVAELRRRCLQAAEQCDGSLGVDFSAAQEACFSAILLLDALTDAEPSRIARIAQYRQESIDSFVQMEEGFEPKPDLEGQIEASQLMRSELRKQRSDLSALKTMHELDPSRLADFRARVLSLDEVA